ncbi:MAG: WYL domain-containing protein [Microthrixaceae bacterium]
MAKLDRLLNLTAALIDTTIPLTAEQIRERVPDYPEGRSAFHRAFERDKDDLREMGIPLETVTVTHTEQPISAYTIDQETYALPDPGLTPEELAALYLASTSVMLEGHDEEDLEFAFRKLGGSGASSESVGTPLATVPVSPSLAKLFEATIERRQVDFGYSGGQRRLQPYRLQFERGHWYLSGHDLDRDDHRSFRLDRIEGDVVAGPPGSFERPESPRGVLTRPWEMGGGPAVPVRVHIDREPAQATLVDHPDLTVIERSPNGSVVVELLVTNPNGLWHFMVNLLDRAEILEPPEMRVGLIQYLTSHTVAATAIPAATPAPSKSPGTTVQGKS